MYLHPKSVLVSYCVLAEKAKAAGISMSEFVRRMIKEYAFHEKPDAEFMRLFLNLSQHGDNIARLANDKDVSEKIDVRILNEEIESLRVLKSEIKRRFLSNWKNWIVDKIVDVVYL